MGTAAAVARCAPLALAGVLAAPAAAAAAPPPAPAPAAAPAAAGAAAPGIPAAEAAGYAPAAAAYAGRADARQTGYRYWSFWIWDADEGDWEYASQGPGTVRPADGDLLGFRFAVSENSRDGERPRGDHTFEEVCADVPAESGGRRVALVLDFGVPADAPRGERPPRPRTACAVLDEGAAAAEALAAEAAPLRYHGSGLLCAIDGYPERGCGEPATVSPADPADPADGTDPADPADAEEPPGDGGGDAEDPATDTGPHPFGVWLGVAAVAVLAAAALGRSRRRQR